MIHHADESKNQWVYVVDPRGVFCPLSTSADVKSDLSSVRKTHHAMVQNKTYSQGNSAHDLHSQVEQIRQQRILIGRWGHASELQLVSQGMETDIPGLVCEAQIRWQQSKLLALGRSTDSRMTELTTLQKNGQGT